MIRPWNFAKYVSLTKEVDWWSHFQYLMTSSNSVSDLWITHNSCDPVSDVTNRHQFTWGNHGTNFKFIPHLEGKILRRVKCTPSKMYAQRVNIIEWVVSGSQMGRIKELYLSAKDYLKETTHNDCNAVNLHRCSSWSTSENLICILLWQNTNAFDIRTT